MSSLINVNLATTEQLTEVCFRGSSCIDISPELRKELYGLFINKQSREASGGWHLHGELNLPTSLQYT